MPSGDQLSHTGIIGEHRTLSDPPAVESINPLALTHSNSLGAGLPPVPAKLDSKIESRAFIEMVNLLPEWLGTYYTDKESKVKKPAITNLLVRSGYSALEYILCSSTGS